MESDKKDRPKGQSSRSTLRKKKQNNNKTVEPSKVTELPSTTYDSKAVAAFLEKVFHAELEADEEILTWIATKVPGYPITEETLVKKLSRLKKHQAFYFGTSTCKPGKDGFLYNRKALFSRLHMVVLDDIGSKIPKDSMPPGLEPTYIIESSEGNEQWGFVLEEPIDNLEQAQVFVSLVYNSGFTDTGGNMPTKLVRLPVGFNMKTGKEEMPVRLLKDDGPRWTPDALLEVLDTGVRWDDIVNDPDLVRKTTLTTVQGATVWAPVHAEMPTFDGVVDPALEWLYEQHMVYQERDEWVDIQCPWHTEHSEQGAPHDRAGYSPLGWGGETHAKSRGYHCFHAACNHRTGLDFLEYVAANGGPELPLFDYIPEMLSTYVYDPVNDQAWDVKSSSLQPTPFTLLAMRNLYARKVRHVTYKGELKLISPVGLWMVNPSRVVAHGGVEYRPSCRSAMFEDEAGKLKVNLFRMKQYPDVPISDAAVKVFYDYIDYLIPAEDERKFFLDWLACKVQDPSFRGPALFMIADQQGTGRNTLMDMIGQMFGQQHMKHVPFQRLLSAGGYNTHQESLFVVVDETLAVEDYSTTRRAGDILKEMIDPRPQHTLINPKYGKQRDVWSVSSYVFLSNHDDGLKLAAGDRRYYAIRNAHNPAAPAYFTQVNAWMQSEGWETHLWNDLMAREVDAEIMVAPPAASETMRDVIEAGRSPLEMILAAFIQVWPTTLVPRGHARRMLDLVNANGKLLPDNLEGVFRRVWKTSITPAYRNSSPMPLNGEQHRFAVKGGVSARVNGAHVDWDRTRRELEVYDETAALGAVLEILADWGLDL